MKINEVTSPLKTFIATVRVSGTQAKTTIDAENISQARQLFAHVYGASNVVSVGPVNMVANEETKTLSSSELQVKSLANQAQRLNQQAKLKKAQTGLAKAQQSLFKAGT